MAIDPDMEPILDDIIKRIVALEAANNVSIDLQPIFDRLMTLEEKVLTVETPADLLLDVQKIKKLIRDSAALSLASFGGGTGPADPEPEPSFELPEGYKAMGSFNREHGASAKWDPATTQFVMTNWKGGAGTWGDPNLLKWNADGSVESTFQNGVLGSDTNGPKAGVLQLFRPTYSEGRVGLVMEVLDPGAVVAFFTYEDGTKKEFDFELGKVNGVVSWIIGIHMPKVGGGKVSSEKVTVPLEPGIHEYEIEHGQNYVAFFIDGEEVARFTPENVAGADWRTNIAMQLVISIEKHGAWAGWSEQDYATNKAHSRLYGIKA